MASSGCSFSSSFTSSHRLLQTKLHSRTKKRYTLLIHGSSTIISQQSLTLEVKKFFLPQLSCPFPLQRNPSYHSITSPLHSWLLHWSRPSSEDQKTLLLQSDFSSLGCSMLPWSPSRHRMLLFCKFCAWLICFHEFRRDQEVDMRMMERTLKGEASAEELQSSREIEAFHGLLQLLRYDASPKLYHRYVEALKGLLLVGSANADLASCISSRRSRVLMFHLQIMTEYCTEIELDDESLALQGLKEIHEIAADWIGWSMDLLSFRRDYYRRDFHNSLSFLYLGYGGSVSFQECVDEVERMISKAGSDFVCKTLYLSDLTRGRAEVRKYLLNLPQWMSGMLEWCYRSSILHGKDHSVGKERKGWVVMHPKKTIIQPFDPQPKLMS